MTTMTPAEILDALDPVKMTTQRLRAMDLWSDDNPPESGVVRGAKVETAAERVRRVRGLVAEHWRQR